MWLEKVSKHTDDIISFFVINLPQKIVYQWNSLQAAHQIRIVVYNLQPTTTDQTLPSLTINLSVGCTRDD